MRSLKIKKRIRELKTEYKSKISVEELLASDEMTRHLQTVANAVLMDTGKTYRVINRRMPGVGYCTNGETILMNPETRIAKLFLDPEADGKAYIDKMMEKESFRKLFVKLFHEIVNRVEDQNNEELMKRRYGKYVTKCISLLRVALMTDYMPIETARKRKLPPLAIILNCILQYARCGEILTSDDTTRETDPIFLAMNEITPYLDEAILSTDTSIKADDITRVIFNLVPFFKEEEREKKKEKGGSHKDKSSEDSPKEPSDRPDDSSEGESEGSPDSKSSEPEGEKAETPEEKEDDEADKGDAGKEKEASDPDASSEKDDFDDGEDSSRLDASSEKDDPGEGDESSKADDSSDEDDSDEDEDSSKLDASSEKDDSDEKDEASEFDDSFDEDDSDEEESSDSSDSPFEGMSDDEIESFAKDLSEMMEKSFSETDSGSMPPVDISRDSFGGKTEVPDEEIEPSDGRSLLDELAERKAEETAESEAKAESKGDIKGIDRCDPNHIRTILDQDFEVTSSSEILVNSILQEVRPYSKRLQKKILDAFKDLQTGEIQRHKQYGKMIEARDVYRKDQRFFSDKKLPKDMPEVAISVLVDESGSMYLDDRIGLARKAAILLYDFADGLGIPVSVAGHSVEFGSYSTINYHLYTDFDSTSSKSIYKLGHINAGGDNRDGKALEVSAERLAKRPEEIKMLFIISDGAPMAPGYSGPRAKIDIQRVVKNAHKKGIEIFACAIGDDRDEIYDIYGDDFLNIEDLNNLPKTLVKVVKKRLMQAA